MVKIITIESEKLKTRKELCIEKLYGNKNTETIYFNREDKKMTRNNIGPPFLRKEY